MFEKFLNLDIEKQKQIINAAAEEFGGKGYDNASTNEIVKNANISKGLLFHYFGNKKALYLFLLDYSINLFSEEFYGKFDYAETDFIKRWGQISLLKIDLIHKYSVIYQFLLASSTELNPEIKKEIDERTKTVYEQAYKKMLIDIDTSLYRYDMEASRVSDIIMWVTQGFASNELEKLKRSPDNKLNFDVNSVMPEFNEYMKLLKRAFYK